MRFTIGLLGLVVGAYGVGCSKENNVSVSNSEDGVVECAAKPPTPGFIDDFECGLAGALPDWEGRTGGYFTASDDQEGNTFVDPNHPDFVWEDLRCPYSYDSDTAGCAQGKTADCGEPSTTCWGAVLGLGLTVDGSIYDAADRGYTGVRFMLRNVKGGPPQALRFAISDANTFAGSGRCTLCDDYFSINLSATSTWQEVTVRFADLQQRGFGDPQPALEPSELLNMEWAFGPGQDVQVAIDDLAFISD
jgi:hypothetical protein